jgi:hypothetical protein
MHYKIIIIMKSLANGTFYFENEAPADPESLSL